MKFLIITGMSGAGKTSVIKVLEDIGYYCVDNMPPALLSPFADVCKRSSTAMERVALVIDLRGGEMFTGLFQSLDDLSKIGVDYEILFLDSSDDTLVKRYKETRRNHPLSGSDRLLDGILRERKLLDDVKNRADYIIDTTKLHTSQLRDEIHRITSVGKAFKSIVINVMSFGFKYGIPLDVDLLFDVRFLPNPFYIPDLKQKSGLDIEVRDYVCSFEQTNVFIEKLNDMVNFLIPHYIEEGKHQLVIAIGCTGGKHRSVTIAEALKKFLIDKEYQVVTDHRDCLK